MFPPLSQNTDKSKDWYKSMFKQIHRIPGKVQRSPSPYVCVCLCLCACVFVSVCVCVCVFSAHNRLFFQSVVCCPSTPCLYMCPPSPTAQRPPRKTRTAPPTCSQRIMTGWWWDRKVSNGDDGSTTIGFTNRQPSWALSNTLTIF